MVRPACSDDAQGSGNIPQPTQPVTHQVFLVRVVAAGSRGADGGVGGERPALHCREGVVTPQLQQGWRDVEEVQCPSTGPLTGLFDEARMKAPCWA